MNLRKLLTGVFGIALGASPVAYGVKAHFQPTSAEIRNAAASCPECGDPVCPPNNPHCLPPVQ